MFIFAKSKCILHSVTEITILNREPYLQSRKLLLLFTAIGFSPGGSNIYVLQDYNNTVRSIYLRNVATGFGYLL
jgi:hypothetical protein